MNLDALLAGHKAFYKSNSEKRLAAWLREDIQAFLNGMASGPGSAGLNGPPSSPPASTRRSLEKKLAPAEVAKRLNLKIKTIANWRSRKEGPRWFKIGGSVYYLESDIDSWEQDQFNGGKP